MTVRCPWAGPDPRYGCRGLERARERLADAQ